MPKTLRDKILKEQGYTRVQAGKKKHHKLKPARPSIEQHKTPTMRWLEIKYDVRMEDVLTSGSLSIVASKLGNEVDTSTISKWIKKLKLRYTADNLPSCEDCPHRRPACELGVCMLLVDLEQWDLIELKKEELTNA